MQKFYKIIILILLVAVLFVPFCSITVAPEWQLLFVNKNGSPAASIRIEQIWKDYSFEWSSEDNTNEGLQTDSNGYLKLPTRKITVSIFEIIISRIRNLIMSANPHSSFGPSSFLICRGTANCVVNYKDSNEIPQRVELWNN